MKPLKAVGVYIFAGGFTIGVKKHFEILAHLEDGNFGVATSKRNLGVDAYVDPDTWPTFRNVDFVYANPPCAPWSSCSAGRKVHWADDPRVDCIRRTFKLLDTLKPKVLAIESVRPFFTKGRELVDDLAAKANQKGYHATVLYVNGANHGVAQHRPRLFFVLSKVQIPWSVPKDKPLHVKDVLSKKFKTATPIRLGPQYNELVKATKPGERAAAVYTRLNKRKVAMAKRFQKKVVGRPSFQLQRLDPDGYCSVLTGDCRKIHPTQHRMITVEEAAALSGFPPDYQFSGSVGNQTSEIAKGVMPPVGEYLARHVAQAIQEKKRVTKLGLTHLEVRRDKIEEHLL